MTPTANETGGPGTLLLGGTVIDPELGATSGDVLLRDGRVAALGEAGTIGSEAAKRVDVSGLFLAPGFIDIHAHVFHRPGVASTRLEPDRVGVRQGVACLVDAGSSGAATLDEFREARASQETPVFALVNIGSPGLSEANEGHSSRPGLVSLKETVAAAERNREWVRGIKVQASASHTGTYGMTAVALARKAADLTGLPLMMHIGNSPPVLDEVLPYLRAGDIVTHTYHGKVGGALTNPGDPLPALVEAVRRGVRVDIGHGRSSFSFTTAEQALAKGLPVHTISTDIHRGNVDRYVVSLARTMSKLMLLGLSLEDVVRAVTGSAARSLRLGSDGFGSIRVDGPAHLTVFRVRNDALKVEDAEGEIRRAEQWIEPVAVYSHGRRFDVCEPI
jgi:dihydroorotase